MKYRNTITILSAICGMLFIYIGAGIHNGIGYLVGIGLILCSLMIGFDDSATPSPAVNGSEGDQIDNNLEEVQESNL